MSKNSIKRLFLLFHVLNHVFAQNITKSEISITITLPDQYSIILKSVIIRVTPSEQFWNFAYFKIFFKHTSILSINHCEVVRMFLVGLHEGENGQSMCH